MSAKAEVVLLEEDKARNPKTIERLVALWNRHYGEEIAISPRLVEWTLAPRSARAVALIVSRRRLINDFAIVSHSAGALAGTIDATLLPVPRSPSRRTARRSMTTDEHRGLQQAVEAWLQSRGASAVRLGGGPWSLMRGYLMAEGARRMPISDDVRRAYHARTQDFALDVSRYVPPTSMENVGGVVHPAQPRDRDDLLKFLGARSDVRVAATNNEASPEEIAHMHTLIASDARISDLMVLWTGRGLQGVCQMIFADSATPLEIAYPYTLPRPWAALGVVATHVSLPEGSAQLLLDAAIRRLHNNGVNSCVVTGVISTSNYEQLGFRNLRDWTLVIKNL